MCIPVPLTHLKKWLMLLKSAHVDALSVKERADQVRYEFHQQNDRWNKIAIDNDGDGKGKNLGG